MGVDQRTKRRVTQAHLDAMAQSDSARCSAGSCRRCSECVGMSHHWMLECDEKSPQGFFRCKHCDTVGMECALCDGSGRDNPLSKDAICPECDGEGVVSVESVCSELARDATKRFCQDYDRGDGIFVDGEI